MEKAAKAPTPDSRGKKWEHHHQETNNDRPPCQQMRQWRTLYDDTITSSSNSSFSAACGWHLFPTSIDFGELLFDGSEHTRRSDIWPSPEIVTNHQLRKKPMVKRKARAKRSLSSLPKGLPVRGGNSSKTTTTSNTTNTLVNPFEAAWRTNKRAKHNVVNRPTTNSTKVMSSQSALARALKERQTKLREEIRRSKKSNTFIDGRIGEHDPTMTSEEQTLARLVRERSRRSKRNSKFSLDDNDDDDDNNNNKNTGHFLTHGGKALDVQAAKHHVLLSDDDEDDKDRGQLDALDTQLHFGGGNIRSSSSSTARATMNHYGPNTTMTDTSSSSFLQHQYTSRKTELDDLIARRKLRKAERLQSKEDQVEAFTRMDESYHELADLLQFRDKGLEEQKFWKARKEGTLSQMDTELVDWEMEMKQYQSATARTVAATDRTKTLEEVAQEEAERLQTLETKRLARMNGEYGGDSDDDALSDISDVEDHLLDKNKSQQPRPKKKKRDHLPDEQLENDDSDDDGSDNDDLQPRFTADGLVQVDPKTGRVVGKVDATGNFKSTGNDEQDENESGTDQEHVLLSAGTRAMACYRAKEQFDGHLTWHHGTIAQVHHVSQTGPSSSSSSSPCAVKYDVDYDDGDYENGVEAQHIRPLEKRRDELDQEEEEEEQKKQGRILQRKRQKATEKAM